MNRQDMLTEISFLGSGHERPLPPGASLAFATPSRFANAQAPQKPARKRIWDLSGHYHCSIVGTCLTTVELRKLLTKLGMAGADDSDHDLHGRGVGLASRQDLPAKLLNKVLDERHHLTIKRYGRAKTEAELPALWQQDVKSGDIPGGYWAVMTHPLAGYALVREAFGYVHMLSHLVGAANRADIRRLQRLEEENASLGEKIARQQAQIRDMTISRDAIIAGLQRNLSENASPGGGRPGGGRPGGGRPDKGLPSEGRPDDAALRDVIADLRRQLDAQTRRRIGAEDRRRQTQAREAAALERACAAESLAMALQAELDTVAPGLSAGPGEATALLPDLGGLTVLYVGGRPAQIPHIREAAARRGAGLLYHDGGVEDNDLLLGSLVGRADIVVFPVDCVSHAAAGIVKRCCRNAGKEYVALRSGAVTSFIAALGRLRRCETPSSAMA